MSEAAQRWHLAGLAAAVLAVDPGAMGGIVLRARSGPVRDKWLALANALTEAPARSMPPSIADDRLLGGLDLGATLSAGAPVHSSGVLAEADGATLIVPMAERLEAGTAARLGAALDTGLVPDGGTTPAQFGLILLDEGAAPEERPPEGLCDRLALHISLEGLALADTQEKPLDTADIAAARALLPRVRLPDPAFETLTVSAAMTGITSARATLMAARVARVLAALGRRKMVSDQDLATAAGLVLAPRAKFMPETAEPEEDTPPPPPDQDQPDSDADNSDETGRVEDKVLDAIRALLPNLALNDTARRRGSARSAGSGAREKAVTHGRPAGTRPGKPDGRSRLDLLATLRAAVPWQKLRGRHPGEAHIAIRADDFRLKRFERPSESVKIFVVDASGSAAMARMAEAKGAVELMLAEAYQRREKVALIAFRGTGAELLLPPTRSLVQAKRRLAVLPGGGGTPLASALQSGAALARQIRQRGATPYLVLLTDGRGNIALDGTPGRPGAAEDAIKAAREIAADYLTSILVDTSNRPQAEAADLAKAMGAQYLPLPRADAGRISGAVRTAIGA